MTVYTNTKAFTQPYEKLNKLIINFSTGCNKIKQNLDSNTVSFK